MADRSIVYRLQADISQFRAQMAQAGASVRKAADDMTSATKSGTTFRAGLDTVGRSAGKAGLVAAAGLGAAAKAAIDWETAWAGVTKTTDGTATQMAALEDQLRNLARTMPATHEEIAATAEAAGQLGVARENVASFTKTMLMLGETTNLTADQAATSIAQIANVMQTAPDDIDNFGAALVALGNNGASTEAQIVQMAQRIAGTGAQIGLAESDILGIANAAASMGIEVEAGGSAISRVFTGMAKAVSTGSDKLDIFAKLAGVTADEFSRMFQESPAEAFTAVTEGLDRLNKSGGDVFSTLQALGFSDVRVSQAMLSMAASGDYLRKSLDLGAEAYEKNTALADEFAKRLGTSAAQVKIAWNNIKDAAIDVGATTLPTLSKIAHGVTETAQAFQRLPDPAKEATSSLMAGAAVLGGSIWASSKLVSGIAATRKALADLGLTADVTKGKLAGIGTATGGVVAGMATLQSALDIFDRFQRFNDISEATADSVGELNDLFERSNISKYASDLHINLDRLAQDLVANGKSGEYASEVLDKLNDRLYGATTGRTNPFDSIFGTGPTKAQAALADLNKILDNNSDLLGSGAESADEYADSATSAGKGVGSIAAASRGAAKGIDSIIKASDKAAKKLEASRKAARETAASFFGLGDKVDKAKVSLGGWLRDLEKQADALRNFRVNAQKAAKKGLDEGLIASLQAAGPEGALRMRQLANATDTEIARANKAWQRGQKEIERYTDAVGGVPEKATTKVDAQTAAAMSGINAVEYRLNSLPNYKRVTIEVRTVRTGSDGAGGPRETYATGGYVRGPGTATSDSIPAWLSNGEYIVNAAATARHRSTLEAINSHAYAGGGYVGSGSGGSIGGGGKEILALRTELRQINRHLEHIDRSLPDRLADANVSALNYSTASRARRP